MDELLTPKEAARRLSLSVYTVKEYARRGILPAVKVGGVWRFSQDALSRWLSHRTVGPEGVSEISVVRDAMSERACGAPPGFKALIDRRRAASEGIDAVRLRSRTGDLRELLDEHRKEMLRLSERMGE